MFKSGLSILKLALCRATTLCVLVILGTVAPLEALARDYRPHPGYLDSTVYERDESEKDLELISPLPDDGPSLHDRIFNEQLSKEFREKYEDKFGRTDAERIYFSPNRTSYYNDVWYRGSPQELDTERRTFGNFMIKRLAEYHVDNYLKNDPRGKAIYQLKERVSNVGVQVQKFKFDFRYELAGNTFDVIVKNPYLDTAKLRLVMGGFGPGNVTESILTLAKVVTKTITLEGYLRNPDARLSLIARKLLTTNLSSSVSLVSGRRDLGPTPGFDQTWIRESVYLAGMNYSF